MAKKNHYLLLTPGPLSTSENVKKSMLKDWCTWDNDYNKIVQNVREKLVKLAEPQNPENYTTVLMQGSGTFAVESVIGSVIPHDGKLLVIANGVYGQRIATIAKYLNIAVELIDCGEIAAVDLVEVENVLQNDKKISHLAIVHCETTTGMLNPIEKVALLAKKFGKIFIVDAMSSFGGIPIKIEDIHIDFLISSSNKCIQGVPGFGFVLAKKTELEKTKGFARSLSLDLYDQWITMEKGNGKWRFTSPTHVVRAFVTALDELEDEGGISARSERYKNNQTLLVKGMEKLGFLTLLPSEWQSPIITSFFSPQSKKYSFEIFYELLKKAGFVIYPGKVINADCFRIGNIGEVYEKDIINLLSAIKKNRYWEKSQKIKEKN